jgi:lipopolysaccharide/colanic/teichoic acid biosynthesis glycosyltransferase
VSTHAQQTDTLLAEQVLAIPGVHPIYEIIDAAPAPWRLDSIIPVDRLQQITRRSVNVLLALVGLILAAPLMLVITVLITLTSPGPIIFRQTRVGLDRRRPDSDRGHWRRQVDYGGRLFTMYKFRTMAASTDSHVQVWAQPNDPRVTAIGRVLRKYRLDEIPQLFNVVKGDMNFVGPRPEQPKIFAELRENIDQYPRRQSVLPGITGWAQINQSYDSCVEDVRSKLHYDLEYIERQSVLQDLKIVFLTVPVVIFRLGAW